MINYLYVKLVITNVLILLSFTTSAQSKFGKDEQTCKENVSVFREYCKQKNFEDALNPWRWAYNNCPASYATIYKNGPKIIKAQIKKYPNNKIEYVDTLMMIFDQRIKYGFGKEGYILGLKGYELFFIDKNRAEEAYQILKTSLNMDKNSSSVQAVYAYMKATIYLQKKGKKSKEDVLSAYSLVSEIVDYNIKNQSKTTKNFIKYSQKIEDMFTPYANCDDIISLYNDRFQSSKSDIDLLKRIEKILSDKDCIKNKLYLDVLNVLQEIDDSSHYAIKLAEALFANGDFLKSSNVFNKILQDYDLQENLKARILLNYANSLRMEKKYSEAIAQSIKALQIKPDWGEAYLLQGNIYVSGSKSCGNDFEQTTVYWLAVDCFVKAKLDDDVKDLAVKSINTYSKYFPNKETCFFNGIQSGEKYNIGCWINRATIARTID
tara:strand:+ start:2776 stop:4080 length:1305 start_codon:yes stop_codon:yes gene_type:complete